MELNAGFVPVRKPGKLPFDRHTFQYDLEYGTDTLEIHTDCVVPGQNVLVVDDLLATGCPHAPVTTQSYTPLSPMAAPEIVSVADELPDTRSLSPSATSTL